MKPTPLTALLQVVVKYPDRGYATDYLGVFITDTARHFEIRIRLPSLVRGELIATISDLNRVFELELERPLMPDDIVRLPPSDRPSVKPGTPKPRGEG